MSVKAARRGNQRPRFCAESHRRDQGNLNVVPPPYVLKPRSDVSAIGIRKWKAVKKYGL